MFSSIAGRSVLVTGGTRGIGKGLARVFARAGATVTVAGRDEPTAQASAQELTARGGGTVTYLLADVATADAAARRRGRLPRGGGLDVLCANAGIFPTATLAEMTEMTSTPCSAPTSRARCSPCRPVYRRRPPAGTAGS